MTDFVSEARFEQLEVRVGSLEEEMATVKAGIAYSEKFAEHFDKRQDKQDARLGWILTTLIGSLLTICTFLAIYIVENVH